MNNTAAAKKWLLLAATGAIAALGLCLRGAEALLGVHILTGNLERALLFGIAIVAAAFILSWAAETAEMDVSQGLALAAIALIAVLPEYAVDLYFAWRAPHEPIYALYTTANMTGANRLLVGMAWPMIFFIFWLRTRKRILELGSHLISLEILFLGTATLYSFLIPLKGNLSLIDTLVLVPLFAAYLYLSSRAPAQEPELVGPARVMGALAKVPRRSLVIMLFLYAAASILASVEPFAESLVATGKELGIDEFLLVQWLAPLASEAPEFTVAAILAFRGRAQAAMTMLISAKVNQWTLLIGTLPLAYSLSGATLSPLPMDARQVGEVFLTAAQSAFAVAILASLSISLREALLLLGLFSTQLVLPDPTVRYGFAVTYLMLAAFVFFQDRQSLPIIFRAARSMAAANPSSPVAHQQHARPREEDVGRGRDTNL